VLLGDALALVYLSLFEGFGLPPLEAMARGTAAVVSDATSLPEVVGDAALVVDPHDVAAVADALITVAVDGERRRQLERRGRARAAGYHHVRTGTALRAALEDAARIGQPIGGAP
jgi:glycosyltransferase involved in cell wall biosynthesis